MYLAARQSSLLINPPKFASKYCYFTRCSTNLWCTVSNSKKKNTCLTVQKKKRDSFQQTVVPISVTSKPAVRAGKLRTARTLRWTINASCWFQEHWIGSLSWMKYPQVWSWYLDRPVIFRETKSCKLHTRICCEKFLHEIRLPRAH